MCVRACVCIGVLNVGWVDETFRVLTGTALGGEGGGNKDVRVLGWAAGFYLRTAIFSTCRLFVFLLIDKVEFVSFDNSAGSIFFPALFFSQNFISSFIC